MNHRDSWACVAVFAVACAAGCASSGTSSTASTSTATTQPAVTYAPPPADSPFAKIKVGMVNKQVYDLIGPPTDTSTYTTGKAWIPFYYGGDLVRQAAHYKGIGRIIFSQDSRYSSDMSVSEIQYDPTETGYH